MGVFVHDFCFHQAAFVFYIILDAGHSVDYLQFCWSYNFILFIILLACTFLRSN